MATLKKNADFHKKFRKHIRKFQKGLKDAGYNLKVSKILFEPSLGLADDCPCGTETYKDPQTGQWVTGCKRCPPPRP